jgi:hypothetical protein
MNNQLYAPASKTNAHLNWKLKQHFGLGSSEMLDFR